MIKADLESLPTFFIIGAAKAGTTTLYDVLKQYRGVYFPAQKEPSFFCDEEYYAKGVDWYISTFYSKSKSYPARGEATPRYLYWGERVVPRLSSLYADYLPKIIVIFRDPVKLVYSYYWQNVREGREPLSFRDALDVESDRLGEYQTFLNRRGRFTYLYSKIGMYASQLQPYLEVFPLEKILFLLTDDLGDFSALTEKLERFLELEHKEWPKPVTSNIASLPRSKRIHQWLVRPSKFKDGVKNFLPYSVRHRIKKTAININLKRITPPPPDPDLVDMLKGHYQQEVLKLETIINRDLSAWYSDSETDEKLS
jgi:hypothetical protein